jgi:hypothetical protein
MIRRRPDAQDRPANRRCAPITASLLILVTLTAMSWSAPTAGAASSLPTFVAQDRGALTTTADIPSNGRDCGLSTPLSDGNQLWIFCDPYYRSNTGAMHYRLYNGAALASPSGTVMHDQSFIFGAETLLNGRPRDLGQNFITLPESPQDFPCPAPGVRKAWPRSAVTIPAGGATRTDRVLVYYTRACDQSNTKGLFSYTFHGVGVAEYLYTPGSFTPGTAPTTPTLATGIVDDLLFPATQTFQYGATPSADHRWIYLYDCVAGGAGCRVARVDPESAGNSAAYRYWTGMGWGAQADARPMTMPGNSSPLAMMNVQWIPQSRSYVMLYTPCAASCLAPQYDRVAVRTAAGPEGPWSAPVTVMVPGCTASWAQTPCNTALVKPQLSTATELGFSFARRHEFAALPGDRLHTGTIPMSALTPVGT